MSTSKLSLIHNPYKYNKIAIINTNIPDTIIPFQTKIVIIMNMEWNSTNYVHGVKEKGIFMKLMEIRNSVGSTFFPKIDKSK